MRGEDLGRHLAQLARLERHRLAVRPDLVRVRARARARARVRVRVRVTVGRGVAEAVFGQVGMEALPRLLLENLVRLGLGLG